MELLTNAKDHAALPRLFKKYQMKVVRKDTSIFLEGNTDALLCEPFRTDVGEYGFTVTCLFADNGWHHNIVLLERKKST